MDRKKYDFPKMETKDLLRVICFAKDSCTHETRKAGIAELKRRGEYKKEILMPIALEIKNEIKAQDPDQVSSLQKSHRKQNVVNETSQHNVEVLKLTELIKNERGKILSRTNRYSNKPRSWLERVILMVEITRLRIIATTVNAVLLVLIGLLILLELTMGELHIRVNLSVPFLISFFPLLNIFCIWYPKLDFLRVIAVLLNALSVVGIVAQAIQEGFQSRIWFFFVLTISGISIFAILFGEKKSGKIVYYTASNGFGFIQKNNQRWLFDISDVKDEKLKNEILPHLGPDNNNYDTLGRVYFTDKGFGHKYAKYRKAGKITSC
jgi:hypothetical protein